MEKVKPIAFYLPQFHQVKENDKWWGTGFTEWSAVRASEPLFEGHSQPRQPLNKYYYDLLNKSTMEWQANLARKYGIYGFCFYHYWFADGRMILEKPAENLLKWNDIDMPYCFSWANESWIRTWGNIFGGNVWSGKFEAKKEENENSQGILLLQQYGNEKEWRLHFEYMLPFFKDKRYIKCEGKPVFILYRPELMSYCANQMMRCWKKWAVEEGLLGIYVVLTKITEEYPEDFCPIADAILEQEPTYSIVRKEKSERDIYNKKGTANKIMSYDNIWNDILKRNSLNEKRILFSAFTDYDTSPRRGNAGRIFQGGTPKKFKQYLQMIMEKSIVSGNELMFINAWNEWAEGMYLEPDEEYKFSYLQAVKDALNDLNLEQIKVNIVTKKLSIGSNITHNGNSKFEGYFKMLSRWLTYKQENKSLETFFLKNGYHSIAIYGLGIMGKHLCSELQNSSVEIKYAIDKGAESTAVRILTPDDVLPNVDAVIVTPTLEFCYIEEMLQQKIGCPIISLENVIMECF